jgi:hypothetical protein
MCFWAGSKIGSGRSRVNFFFWLGRNISRDIFGILKLRRAQKYGRLVGLTPVPTSLRALVQKVYFAGGSVRVFDVRNLKDFNN